MLLPLQNVYMLYWSVVPISMTCSLDTQRYIDAAVPEADRSQRRVLLQSCFNTGDSN